MKVLMPDQVADVRSGEKTGSGVEVTDGDRLWEGGNYLGRVLRIVHRGSRVAIEYEPRPSGRERIGRVPCSGRG